MSTTLRSYSILFIAGAGVGGQLLARILRRRGHKVSVLKPKTVMKKRPSGFDFILITTYSNLKTLRETIVARNAVIEKTPHATTVLGGPGFSEQPEAYLRQYKADYGLVGEADRTIEDLFEVFERFGTDPAWGKIKHIPGAARRASNNRTYLNPNRPVVTAEEIDWELMPSHTSVGGARKNFNFQRGCPNHCSFCCKWFGDKVRSASTDTIFRTIERLAASPGSKKITEVCFNGELFLPRAKAIELSERIKASSLNGRFRLVSDFTVGSLLKPDGNPDEELIDALIGGGFHHIGIGVESFRDNILRDLGKPQTLAQISKVIHCLYEKGIQGHFYMIERTVEARPFDVLMDAYIMRSYWGNGYFAWEPSCGRLEILVGTEMFERYKHDPSRFRNKMTGRPLHPATDMEKLAHRRILVCEAIPYDPLSDLDGSVLGTLWGMEYRLELLKQSGDQPEEQERLEKELLMARKVVRRLPKHFAIKVQDIAFKVKAKTITATLTSKGFLSRWRKAMGNRARLIEHRLGKELYGPNWQDEIRESKKRKNFEGELRSQLWADYIIDRQQVLPPSEVRRAVRKMYDEVLKYPHYIETFALVPSLMNKDELALCRKGIVDGLKEWGRAKFVKHAMEQKDPIGFFAHMLTMSQLVACKDVMRLHRIDPKQDSRTVLFTGNAKNKWFRKLRKAARPVPTPRC